MLNINLKHYSNAKNTAQNTKEARLAKKQAEKSFHFKIEERERKKMYKQQKFDLSFNKHY